MTKEQILEKEGACVKEVEEVLKKYNCTFELGLKFPAGGQHQVTCHIKCMDKPE